MSSMFNICIISIESAEKVQRKSRVRVKAEKKQSKSEVKTKTKEPAILVMFLLSPFELGQPAQKVGLYIRSFFHLSLILF